MSLIGKTSNWKVNVHLINNSPQVAIIVTAYRKASVILSSLTSLHSVLLACGYTFQILVIIDGDEDGTEKIVNHLNLPNVACYVNSSNKGKGYSVKKGILLASASEFVGFIDGDCDIDPNGIVTALEEMQNSNSIDLVIGSKWHKDSKVNYSLMRRIQSRLYSILVTCILRIYIKDTQTGLKVGRANTMKMLAREISTDSFSFDVEFLLLALRRKVSVSEMPVSIHVNSGSTVSLRKSLEAVTDLIRIKKFVASDSGLEKERRVS